MAKPSPAQNAAPAGRDWKRIAASAGTGALLTLSFPRTGASFLAWAALVPLLLSLSGQGAKKGFFLGLVAGLAHFLSLLYWVVIVLSTYGGLAWPVAVLAAVLLSAYLALYVGAFSAAFAKTSEKSPVLAAALAPVFWVAAEYARAHLLTGFPWSLLGYSQGPHPLLIQSADMGGVYVVSFLAVMVNAAVALGVQALWRPGGAKAPKKAAAGLLLAAVTLVGADMAYGRMRLSWVDEAIAGAESIRVSVLQGNVDQAVKWDPAYQDRTMEIYAALACRAGGQDPDLVVWPETALPFYFGWDRTRSNAVRRAAREADAFFLVGSPGFELANGENRQYNSAFLLSPDGSTTGRYDKVHLVPFGEYVPLQKILFFLDKLVAQAGDFSRGREGSVLAAGKADLGVLICYEVIFPGLAKSAVQNGANLLVTITNDAWFGQSSAPYQHFSMAAFRAVENRRSLVRAANTGISGFVDPAGRVLGKTPIFVADARTRAVPLLAESTIYSARGDVFALACTALALASLLVLFRPAGPWYTFGRNKAR
ncbi:MAG: apolipoprotein N-acyltransferase [Deltaproteobacteria bacterium]|nr:apolipoprotein N-acyltransferase [Deltaproteobacteria bacterium]